MLAPQLHVLRCLDQQSWQAGHSSHPMSLSRLHLAFE